jgi:hypothetical protein
MINYQDQKEKVLEILNSSSSDWTKDDLQIFNDISKINYQNLITNNNL